MSSLNLLQRLEPLAQAEQIRHIDLQLAKLMLHLGANAEVALLAALVSFELGRGHLCLPLNHPKLRCFDLDLEREAELLAGLAPKSDWLTLLQNSPLVGQERDDESARWPLRLWNKRLYLTRYHDYEAFVAAKLGELSQQRYQPSIKAELDRLFAPNWSQLFEALEVERATPLDAVRARRWLENHYDLRPREECEGLAPLDGKALVTLLNGAKSAEALAQQLPLLLPDLYRFNGQKLAVATAAGSALAVISGGPGTGKTTTVTKLLALLVESGQKEHAAPLIRLVAPTGKAAARLTESIGRALQSLPLSDEVKAAIPTTASTIHRLLGALPDRNYFRHNSDNPLHLDLLVVDEASMVDLPLMAKLLAALPPKARLILLGDKDQLASVEAGAVLGDICSHSEHPLSQAQAQWLAAECGYRIDGEGRENLRDSLAILTRSWRFAADSGIGLLAAACNRGSRSDLNAILAQQFGDIALFEGGTSGYPALLDAAIAGYRPYLTAMEERAEPKAIFDRFGAFQLLCVVREGMFGVEGLNLAVEEALKRVHLIQVERDNPWYAGRPILITQNDHSVGLYNGDIGITLVDEDGTLRVWFELPDGSMRDLLPSRLPPHQSVYAMTVHKSQGSEFAMVQLVLPETGSPLLTRELIYTGITRAKKSLQIYGDSALIQSAIGRRVERFSGLSERLLTCG